MTEQQNQQQPDDQETKGLQMDDQGPSYGSSYVENTPGEIAANRRESLNQAEEAGIDPAQRPDR